MLQRARIVLTVCEFIMACSFPYILIKKEPVPHFFPVPCCKCESCRKDRVQMWQDRVAFEQITSVRSSSFVTLTYDDYTLPADKSVHLSAVQRFCHNLRRELSRTRDYDNPENRVRFFASSEYGEERYRPHYHLCITNLDAYDQRDFDCLFRSWAYGSDRPHARQKFRPMGIMTADGLLPARIRYCIEYINYETPQQQKAYEALGLKPLFHTMSKGIGAKWMEEHQDILRENQGYYVNGKLRPLPYYYKDKLGMIEKYKYIDTLRETWAPYNALLRQRGEKPVDPFNIDDAISRHLLDQRSPESKRTVLSWLIGNEAKEQALVARRILKESKKKIHFA